MNNTTELVFILDRSGSMGGLEKDTIGGFNGMLKKQKEEAAGKLLVTTVLFDDKIETLYDRKDVNDVPEMTSKDYFVRGCTALLDAVGSTIKYIKNAQKAMPKEEKPSKTIFIITTDGYENASEHYDYAKVKHMIEKRQAKNWEFIFLGANIDAIAEANKFGIKASRAATFKNDSAGTAINYQALNKVVSKLRNVAEPMLMKQAMEEEDMFEDVRAYESQE